MTTAQMPTFANKRAVHFSQTAERMSLFRLQTPAVMTSSRTSFQATPFGEFPDVESPSQVLYGVHDGGIPGTGYPTNRGVDPYLATPGANGWSTRYVGIPANGTPAGPPFSSPLAEADPGLNTFAFAGEGTCSPCFGSGVETGIPLRLPNGSLVQGMAGPISPGPLAKPDGYVAKYFSANGEHFIFGSTSRFAEGGNESADLSIYDHNLRTGETHVISNTPSSEDLPEALQCLQGEEIQFCPQRLKRDR